MALADTEVNAGCAPKCLSGGGEMAARAWAAMQKRSSWDERASCRHTTSSNNLVGLHIYGLTMQSLEAAQGGAWSPARDYGWSLDKVVDRLREFAASRGLPEYESFGPDVPFFIRPEPRRKRTRTIDVDR